MELLTAGTPLGEAISELGGKHAQLWELAAIISVNGAPPQIVHADAMWTPSPLLLTAFIALQKVSREMGATRFLPSLPPRGLCHSFPSLPPRGLTQVSRKMGPTRFLPRTHSHPRFAKVVADGDATGITRESVMGMGMGPRASRAKGSDGGRAGACVSRDARAGKRHAAHHAAASGMRGGARAGSQQPATDRQGGGASKAGGDDPPLSWVGTLATGDAALYDGRLLHCGGANRADVPRVLFYLTFRNPIAAGERGGGGGKDGACTLGQLRKEWSRSPRRSARAAR